MQSKDMQFAVYQFQFKPIFSILKVFFSCSEDRHQFKLSEATSIIIKFPHLSDFLSIKTDLQKRKLEIVLDHHT